MNKVKRRFFCILLMISLMGYFGCSSTPKPETETSEPTIINDPGVAAVVDQAVKGIKRQNIFEGKKEYTFCFLGIRGTNGRDVEPVSNNVRVCFSQINNIHLVSSEKVEEAFKTSKIKRNNVFIPGDRRTFITALGEPVDYMVQGKIETGVSNPNGTTGTIIVLEMFRISDNTYMKEVASLDRDYSYMAITAKKKKFGLF